MTRSNSEEKYPRERLLRAFRFLIAVIAGCAIVGANRGLLAQAAGDPSVPQVDPKLADPLSAEQQQVAKRFQKLEELLLRSAELEAAENPARAALLQQAAQLGKQSQLSDLLASAATRLEKKQYSQAVEDQKSSRENLKRLLELLQSENRGERVREQRDQVRRWIEETDRLLRLQKSLSGRTEGGQETQQAAGDQEKLSNKAEDIAKELRGDKEQSASESKENKSSEQKSAEQKSGDKSNERKSDDKEPKTDKPNDGEKPKEGDKPNDSKSKDSKPNDSKSKDSKPNDSKSKDSKSSDDKSSDSKSSDSKSGDSKSGESDPKDGEKKDSGKKDADKKDTDKKSSDGKDPSEKSPEATPPSEPQSGEPQDSKPQDGKPQEGKPQEGNSQQGKSNDQQEQQPQPESKDPTERARKRIEQAKQKMEEAEKELKDDKRKEAVEKQREAEAELRSAIEALEEILRQLREEEIERSLASLETRLRRMLEMQNKVFEETQRLQEITGDQATRQVEIRASNLALEEKKILNEGQRAFLLLSEEGSSAAFPEAMQQVNTDINNIVERLTKADIGKLTVSIEQEVISSLEEMVGALVQVQKEKKDKKDKKQQQGQQPQGEPGEQPLVDKLAELRLIKTLQVRINNRTNSLSQMLSDPADAIGQATETDVLGEVRALAKRQASIQQVTREIVTGADK